MSYHLSFYLFLYSFLAVVGSHRVFLLSSEEVLATNTFRWNKNDSQYLIYLLLITLVFTVIIIPIQLALTFLFDTVLSSYVSIVNAFAIRILATSIAISYFLPRFLLILPDSALGHRHSLQWVWKASAGNGFRIFLLIGAVPSLFNFIHQIIELSDPDSLAIQLIANLLWLLGSYIQLCFLSLCFEWIRNRGSTVQSKLS